MNAPERRMETVLQKLSKYTIEPAKKLITGEAVVEATVHKKTKAIQDCIDLYSNRPEHLKITFMEEYDQLHRETGPLYGTSEEMSESLQNHLAAYLFLRARRNYGEQFNEEKEKRQIKAVAAMLIGHHIHMGTGEGKSSAVLPITAIVQALTSEKRDVILSTANENLLAELRENTKRLLDELPFDFDTNTLSQKDPDTDFAKTLRKEALLQGQYSDGQKKKISDHYWDRKLTEDIESNDQLDKPKPTKPRILFSTEKDLVFTYSEDPGRFKKDAPVIIMDEADIPYRRNTPYQQVGESEYYTVEEIENSTVEWLINYIVSQQIRSDDFQQTSEDGKYELKEGARRQLRNIDLNILINKREYQRYKHTLLLARPHDYEKKRALFTSLDNGISIIAHKLGITIEEYPKFRTRILHVLGEQLPGKKTTSEDEMIAGQPLLLGSADFIDGVLYNIVNQYHQKGKAYVERPDGVGLRDEYIDELMEKHEYSPEVHSAILALLGTYEFVPKNKKASRTVRFQTFVADNADKFVCASGSLFQRDLATLKVKKGGFAEFLEKYTKQNIVEITSPEIKHPPVPEFFQDDDRAIITMVNNWETGDKLTHQPNLVVCWDRNEGQRMYEVFQNHYSETNRNISRIVYLPIDATAQQTQEYCTQLAEGKIDVLISAGNIGFGANIVRQNGEFPNLKIRLFNLPVTQAQVFQALGRRRREGDKAFWYISDTALERSISQYPTDEVATSGQTTREEVKKLREEAQQNRDKRLPFVAKLLQKSENDRSDFDDYVVKFDKQFDEFIQPGATHILREKIEEDIAAANQQLEKELGEIRKDEQIPDWEPYRDRTEIGNRVRKLEWMRENIDWLVGTYGLPESLYWDSLDQIQFMQAAGRMGSTSEQPYVRGIGYFINDPSSSTEGTHSFLQERIDTWYEMRKKNVEKFAEMAFENFTLQTRSLIRLDLEAEGLNREHLLQSFALINPPKKILDLRAESRELELGIAVDDHRIIVFAVRDPSGSIFVINVSQEGQPKPLAFQLWMLEKNIVILPDIKNHSWQYPLLIEVR